jgi:hypothetical protein
MLRELVRPGDWTGISKLTPSTVSVLNRTTMRMLCLGGPANISALTRSANMMKLVKVGHGKRSTHRGIPDGVSSKLLPCHA